MSAQSMYRLVDEIAVRRANGVFWTLTFRPILPHSGAAVGPPRDLVVTVTDAGHDVPSGPRAELHEGADRGDRGAAVAATEAVRKPGPVW
jgi:hypothetical protein